MHCFWCTSLTKCENLLCEDSPHSCAKILRTTVRRFFAQLCKDSLHSSSSRTNLQDEPNWRSDVSLFHQSDAVMSFCAPHFQNLKTWCVKVFHTAVRRFSAQLCKESLFSCFPQPNQKDEPQLRSTVSLSHLFDVVMIGQGHMYPALTWAILPYTLSLALTVACWCTFGACPNIHVRKDRPLE